ncbi:hypothetical protein BC832DRAFT_548054 [Gaertneriomyces semiglobifer]|nr:hypothetical protein BC832DRAFT_548054 [Gaertneriomyces semiglobifer]
MAFVNSLISMAQERQRDLHHKLSSSTFGAFTDSSSYGTSPPKAPPATPAGLAKASSNMNFNPIPTSPGRCSKLKINVLLDSTIYAAGGNLHGRLEVVSSSNRSLKLGEIAVELNGFEEVADKDYGRSQSFLSARIVFQGERTPPSNAVRGPSENGYWQANKGKTTFPFAFRLPDDAPSSYAFQSISSLRYVVTGVVQYQMNGKNDSLFRSKEAFVVENWKTNRRDVTDDPVRARNHRKVWFGGAGEVHIEGTVQKSFFCSGSDVYVQLRVRNDSRRRVQGIKLALARRLLMLREGAGDSSNDFKIVTETVSETSFKEKDFIFDPGEERSNILNIHIPRFIRTVRNTALAEVSCRIVISLSLGALNKPLAIELPINVCHSASLLPPPTLNTLENLHPQHYNVISDDPDVDTPPRSTRKREKNWKATLRARSASPPRTVRASNLLSPPTPKGRPLPWSDDEGDVEEFVAKRKMQTGKSGYLSPAGPSPAAGTLLRDLPPNSPATATLRGIPTKGNIVKSPPIGPAAPVSYVAAAERSKYISRTSIFLDVPTSPNQETITPTSPQNWGAQSPSALDPLKLPSPVLTGTRRPSSPAVFKLAKSGFYDPPPPSSRHSSPLASPLSSSPTYSPPMRQTRPLPNIPPTDDHVPIQYRTASPPLKPRPANYVPLVNRENKPLPDPRRPILSDGGKLDLPPPKANRASARFSAASHISAIESLENNFLDVDFDFGSGFMGDGALQFPNSGGDAGKSKTGLKHRGASKENLRPGLSPSQPISMAKPGLAPNLTSTISPKGMSPRLSEYLAKYSQASGLR